MNRRQQKEKILDEFAAEHSHDQQTLDRYINLYPEARLELLELASEIRLVTDESRFATSPIPDPGGDEAWTVFSSANTESLGRTNPFSQLRGKRFAEISEKLGVSRGFMIGIRDRRVREDSIPERFLSAASQIMEVALEELRQYLREEPGVLATAEFKADKKPMVTEQVTFRQLIDDTEMTEEQRCTALGYLEDVRSD
ncbi:hypothetical protein [Novipirellula sp.]|uniref:hypothetical protein n=1 Tax=Novipirellula sp. TaxID=2795430 RepID=UPI0035645400